RRVAQDHVEREPLALELHVLHALLLDVVAARDRVDELGQRGEDVLFGGSHGIGKEGGAKTRGRAFNFKAFAMIAESLRFLYMPRKLFVTTALPYANGPFHIGHIMEYVQADIWVR